MADTGVKYPGTAATQSVLPEDDKDWANPNNIKVDDDSWASSTYTAVNQISYRLKATNFGFAVPVGATIDGIIVEIARNSAFALSTERDYRVQLLDAAGALVGNDKADTGTDWPDVLTNKAYGAADDTWAASPTVAMVNDSDFGVVLSAKCTVYNTYEAAAVDYIRMTVYYTKAVTARKRKGYASARMIKPLARPVRGH